MRHLLLRFLCLHEAAILALLLWCFWPDFDRFLRIFLCLHFGDCSSGTLFSLRWSAMEYPLTLTVSVLNVWVFCMHMRLFSAFWNAKFALGILWLNSRINFYILARKARDAVSFGLDDVLLIAASDWVCVRPGLRSTAPALADAFPPSGQDAAKSELVDVLSRATEKLSIDWPDEPRESQSSKLDERFLRGPTSRPEWRKLPFFSDLLHEISRSWKQPFSSRLTNAAAADFTNLVVSVEQGYTAILVVEDTLASHLSPSLVPSWKYRPLFPTKPCRTTSAIIGKSYIAAGQAGMAFHTMAILQAY